jgi:peptidoglycan/xylan/chitin deacetylase (PgdA/CDA1 family)
MLAAEMVGPMTRSENGCRVPILVYHHVYLDQAAELQGAVGAKAAGILAEREFIRQMQFLAREGWNVVSTSAVVEWITGCSPLPEKAAALHFDNGWLDTRTVVLPLLRDLKMTATCFPITSGLEAASGGQSSVVTTLTEGRVSKPFMTWHQAEDLLEDGWEIGAHTATHPKLGEVHNAQGDAGVLEEVEASDRMFQQRLGFLPDHFAYPSGSRNECTDALLAGRYRSLRLWHFEEPIQWSFTDRNTSRLAVDCQNIDARVSFEDFQRIFREAQNE